METESALSDQISISRSPEITGELNRTSAQLHFQNLRILA